MATGKRYYWMKLKESFMTSDTIDYFMSQKDGANYVVLYQMLCLKTINTDGRLSRQIGEIIIPYDIPKIQRDLKWFSTDTIRVALELFKAFGLIYEDVDGVLTLADHKSLVGSESDYAQQKRNQQNRNLPKLGECHRLNQESIRLPSGKVQYVDEKRYGGNGMKAFNNAHGVCEMCGSAENLCIHHGNGYSNDENDLYVLCRACHGKAHEGSLLLSHNWNIDSVDTGVENFHTDIENRDKIIDIGDKSIDKESREDNSEKRDASLEDLSCPFSKIRELYHQICISYPMIKAIDGNRRKAVAARWRTYKSLDTFKALFSLAEASPFLKGENDRNWAADFDWMMKATNFAKILEHRYEERSANTGKPSGVLGALQRMHEEAARNDEAGSD